MKSTILIVVGLFVLAACGEAGQTPSDTESPKGGIAPTELAKVPEPVVTEPPAPTSAERQAAANAKRNVKALAAYRKFAEQFKTENGQYPPTKRNFRSAVGAFEDAAESITDDGTKVELGLPEGATIRQPGRIVYRSDGTDFKLIAQRTGDCSVVRQTNPKLIDPKRDFGPGDCTAYGYWTSGAKTW